MSYPARDPSQRDLGRSGLPKPHASARPTPRARPDMAFLQDEYDPADRRPVTWAAVIVWAIIAALAILGFLLGWLIGSTGFPALLDFIAPTAAQARQLGWVAISEAM